MIIKRTLFVAVGIVLLVPYGASAAFNDVALQATTNVTVSVGGTTVTLTIVGNAEQVVARAGDFDIQFATGGANSVTITSADKYNITVSSTAGVTKTFTCGSSSSTLKLERGSSEAATVATVTPTTTACSGDGGGGGPPPPPSGGGGPPTPPPSSAPAPASVPASNVQDQLDAAKAQLNALLSGGQAVQTFTFNFGAGSIGSFVKSLQMVLNGDSDTKVASAGVGSSGKETKQFGPLTVDAVKKFQVKYDIAKPGDSGYGFVGPKTRAKLNALQGGAPVATPATPAVPATPTSSYAPSSIQSQLDDAEIVLKNLLEQQAKQTTQPAVVTPAPAASNTSALQAQLDAAKAALNDLLNKQKQVVAPAPPPASSSSNAALQDQLDAAKKALDELLKKAQ